MYVAKQDPFALLEKLLIATSKVILSFKGHSNTVFAMQLSKSFLFSGSTDLKIIKWNAETGEMIRTFLGHSDLIFALQVKDNELFSAGADIKIFKWNITDGTIINIVPINSKSNIRCLAFKDGNLFSGSQDSTIIKWNTDLSLQSYRYSGRKKILRSVVLWQRFVISAGDDGQIRLWDVSIDSMEPYAVISNHLDYVNCVLVHESTLFSGSADLTIRQWNLTDLLCMKVLLG